MKTKFTLGSPPLPNPLLPRREEREKNIWGVGSQGGSRSAPLSWANIFRPSGAMGHRNYHVSVLVFALIAFIVGGCAVGPNYREPRANAPAQWSEPLAGGETNRSDLVAAWWKTFNDAELDSLIERAVRSNLDLRIAEGRVREARAQRGIAAADLWPAANAAGSYTRERFSGN